jgi:hypothetical protein
VISTGQTFGRRAVSAPQRLGSRTERGLQPRTSLWIRFSRLLGMTMRALRRHFESNKVDRARWELPKARQSAYATRTRGREVVVRPETVE